MRLKRKVERSDYVSFIVLIIFASFFIFIGMRYKAAFGNFDIKDPIGSAQKFKAYILSYGKWAIIALIAFHAIHVIISFIPSVLVQFVGGLIFGFPIGMATSMVGIAIGTAVSFYIARFFGKPVVSLFASSETIQKVENMMGSSVSTATLALLYALPTPKDFFAYFIGLTNMKASKLFLISATCRLPGMIVATFAGNNAISENRTAFYIIAILSAIVGLSTIIFRKQILGFYSRHSAKKDD